MSSKYIYKHLIPSLMATTFLILSACQESMQDVNTRVAKQGERSEDLSARTKIDPELASYSTNPRELKGYSKVAPILAKLSQGDGTNWEVLFNLKNWFIGPSSVAKAKLQAPLASTRDRNDQYIVQQTQHEAFIDKQLYEKLNEEDQAAILLREYLTGLYLLKNLSHTGLCALMQEVYKVKECAQHKKADPTKEKLEDTEADLDLDAELDSKTDISEAQKKEIQRKKDLANRQRQANAAHILESDDKLVISEIASMLETEGTDVVSSTVIRVMEEKGFDVRIFDYKLALDAAVKTGTAKQTEEKSISKELFHTLGQQVKLAARRSLPCSIAAIAASSEICSLKLEEETSENQIVSLNFNISDKLEIQSTSVLTTQAETIRAGVFIDPTSNVDYVLISLWAAPIKEPKKGMKIRSNYLLAREIMVNGKAGLQLAGILSAAGVITEVTPKAESKKFECSTATVNFTLKDDTLADVAAEETTLFVSTGGLAIDSSVLSKLRPIANCQ